MIVTNFLLVSYSIILLFSTIYLIYLINFYKWSIQVYALIWLIIFYAAVPLILITTNLIYGFTFGIKMYPSIKNYHIEYFVNFKTLLATTLFFLFFIIGTNMKRIKLSEFDTVQVRIKNTKITVINLIGFVCILISIISVVIYIYGFGSIEEVIKYKKEVRSGAYLNLSSLPTWQLFFKRFITLALIPLLLFPIVNRKNLFNILLFLFLPLTTIIFSYTVIFESRQLIIDFFLIMIIGSLIYKDKFISSKLVIVMIITALLIPLLEMLFNDIHTNNTISFRQSIDNFIGEFSFGQISLFNAINNNGNWYYFKDFWYEIFGHLLPSSLVDQTKTIVYQNTYFFTGYHRRSIVPPGIIASGYYNLGYLGVVITGYFLGLFIKVMDVFFTNLLRTSRYYSLLYAFAIITIFSYIRTGRPGMYFYSTSMIFLFFILLAGFKKAKM